MDNKTIEITEEETKEKIEPGKAKKSAKSKKSKNQTSTKKFIIICAVLFVTVAGTAIAAMALLANKSKNTTTNSGGADDAVIEEPKYYSRLSGLEIGTDELNNMPIFCIQVPNGTDGARPHAGLQEASIVYEAIAEAGITRFAAVFQNPTNTAIGPIRSLRMYYLEWDTPLGCTIVHAGGAYDAIAALRNGGYNEIDEGAYNWRDGSDYIAPNNLFTDVKSLGMFIDENNIEKNGASAKVYPRLLPEEAEKIRKENQANAAPKTDEKGNPVESTAKLVTNIAINFGNFPDFNTRYTYDPETGFYARSYETGEKEMSYNCTKKIPVMSRDCEQTQIAPSAVVAMEVEESLADDNYHQVIQAIGEGTAYIFQNGEAHKGTWSKSSAASQIVFKDESGNEISFAPGMLWISAIPRGIGNVEY